MMATRELEVAPAEVPELPELGRTEYARACLGAAMLLERDGWCQGTIEDAAGARCVGGAFIEVFDVSPQRITFYGRQAFDRVWTRFGNNVGSTWWNDEVGRTQAEVIAALLEQAWLADNEAR